MSEHWPGEASRARSIETAKKDSLTTLGATAWLGFLMAFGAAVAKGKVESYVKFRRAKSSYNEQAKIYLSGNIEPSFLDEELAEFIAGLESGT